MSMRLIRKEYQVSRNACVWCGTEVEDERQGESALCVECFMDSQVSAIEELGVEEGRDNGAI
jgi:NMD protein affecting ribosome stability and mRNA decay